MPYGLPKDVGGDSPANTKWMENCVSNVKGQGKPGSDAIAICKAQLIKKKRNTKSEDLIDRDVLGKFEVFKSQYINRKMAHGLTFVQAKADFEVYLARNKWEF